MRGPAYFSVSGWQSFCGSLNAKRLSPRHLSAKPPLLPLAAVAVFDSPESGLPAHRFSSPLKQ